MSENVQRGVSEPPHPEAPYVQDAEHGRKFLARLRAATASACGVACLGKGLIVVDEEEAFHPEDN